MDKILQIKTLIMNDSSTGFEYRAIVHIGDLEIESHVDRFYQFRFEYVNTW